MAEQWERIPEPYKLSISALELGSSGEIFAGVKGCGLFMSQDYGKNWSRITPDSLSKNTIASITHTRDGSIFICINQLNYNQIFRSSDKGKSWELIRLTAYYDFRNIVSDTRGNIYIGLRNNIYSYKIDSLKWIEIPTPSNTDLRQLIVNDNDELIALTNNGLYFSKDYGLNWTNKKAGFEELKYYKNRGLFGRRQDSLFHSDDGGHIWREFGVFKILYTNIAKWLVDKNNDIYMLHRNGRILYSNDRGANWTDFININRRNLVNEIKIDSSGSFLCATEWEGLIHTTDQGQVWDIYPMKTKVITLSSIACRANGELIASSADSGVFVLENGSPTWRKVFSPLNSRTLFISTNQKDDIFINCEMGLYRCLSDSRIFVPANTGLDYTANSLAFVDTTLIFAATNAGIYRSTNNGNSWGRSYFQDENQVSPRFLSVCAVSGKVYAGSADSGIFAGNVDNPYFRRIDNGNAAELDITSMIYAGSKFYISTNKGIYTGSDPGLPLEKLQAPPGSENIRIMKFIAGKRFAAVCDKNTIFYSDDFCRSWTEPGQGLPDDSVMSIDYGADGRFFASTKDSGVYQTKIPLGLPVEYLPIDIDIQITPNPSGTTTNIGFDLLNGGWTSVKIYSLDGQAIETLAEFYALARHYQFGWDSRNYVSGTYILVIQNGTGKATSLIKIIK